MEARNAPSGEAGKVLSCWKAYPFAAPSWESFFFGGEDAAGTGGEG